MDHKRKLRPLVIIGLVLSIAGIYTLYRIQSLGAFTEIENESTVQAEVLAAVPGPEDMEIDQELRTLFFISSNPCAKAPEPGGIFYLQLDTVSPQVVKFKFDSPQDFHPHGLSYLKDHDHQYLFTNNHRTDGTHTVEIFKIIGADRLEHQLTISGPELTSPNDLVATGQRQFYVTNDGRGHDRLTRSVDTFFGRKTGSVLFYDGNTFITVVDNLFFPNGIALNLGKNKLYVAETMSGNIVFYRLVDNVTLMNVDNYFVGQGIDNISLDATGGLIATQHSNLWALSRHMKDPKKRSPSRVIHIDPGSKSLNTLYQHSGRDISGVSSAVSFSGSLYLGAVCDNKLVRIYY